jgi:hypothetical protein
MPEGARRRVFISYSHDTPEHKRRVLALAGRLRENNGIDAIVDTYEQSPPQGWPAWCETEIDKADFVLMVCTATYLRRVRGEEEPSTGHGVLWEARLIRQDIYDAGSAINKYVPVVLSDGSPSHVPRPVRGATIFHVETPEGYEGLCRLLTNQPLVPLPPLGTVKQYPRLDLDGVNSTAEPFIRLRRDLAELKQLQEYLPTSVYEESTRTMTMHTLKKLGYES